MSALCGIPEKDAFRNIPQLPFELALMPLKSYRILYISVLSCAIPALIAVGIVIFKKKKSGTVSSLIRRSTENKALKILEKSVPESGGFLEKHQRKDGSWLPLWFGNQYTQNHENPVYGTARVLTYLNDSLPLLHDKHHLKRKVGSLIEVAESFLVEAQNQDGSWGGNKGISGTIEETSLAISALQKDDFKLKKEKGFSWLDEYYKIHELDPSPIGLYFASLWYDEKLYPLTFYLEALRRNMAGSLFSQDWT